MQGARDGIFLCNLSFISILSQLSYSFRSIWKKPSMTCMISKKITGWLFLHWRRRNAPFPSCWNQVNNWWLIYAVFVQFTLYIWLIYMIFFIFNLNRKCLDWACQGNVYWSAKGILKLRYDYSTLSFCERKFFAFY